MKRWWWYRPGRWAGLLPNTTGRDEYGRHAVVIPTHLFGTFVIPFKACDCEDMREFRCVTPGCQWLAMTINAECLVCDPAEDEVAA